MLDANDHAPQFSQASYRASFREDVAVGFNTNAMRVAATDADDSGSLNGLFTYSIIGGNEDRLFRIGAQTGQVWTVILRVLAVGSVLFACVENSDRGCTGWPGVRCFSLSLHRLFYRTLSQSRCFP